MQKEKVSVFHMGFYSFGNEWDAKIYGRIKDSYRSFVQGKPTLNFNGEAFFKELGRKITGHSDFFVKELGFVVLHPGELKNKTNPVDLNDLRIIARSIAEFYDFNKAVRVDRNNLIFQ